MFKDRVEYALFLVDEGYTAPEITKLCGYKNNDAIYQLAKNHGKKIKKAHAAKHEAMRKYKAEGHTMQEVADKFGVAKGTAQQICKGICPQKAKPPKKGYHPQNKGIYQSIDNVKRIISQKVPDFEYAGDYTGSDGTVKLQCKRCGTIITRSWVSVRHGSIVCPHCADLEHKRQSGIKELRRVKEKNQRKVKVEQDRRGRAVKRLLKNITRLHHCPVCGKLTTNKKFCSTDCRNKANWSAKDARRRALIKDNLIDKDISLERLYKRDGGICAICGEPCDWSDSHRDGDTFIVGKKYPSIDHIIPLAKGGEHSWNNVQLAHFSCNSAKGASLVG